MRQPIVRYGALGLETTAEPVTEVDDGIVQLLDDMVETMYAAPGVGLAAPQIGVSLRICVIDLMVGKRPGQLLTLINPEFVERDGMQLEEEGCLSLPGFTATVARPARVVVRALDRDGSTRLIEGTGLLARALQHEVDHLNGLLFVNRLRSVQRRMILRKVRHLARQGRWA
jgi:peptide deformylase